MICPAAAQQEAEQKEAEQKAQAAGQAQTDQYKKAFSACLEGKGYSVK